MNLYPYGSGHLMVAPIAARRELRGPDRRRSDARLAQAQVRARAGDPRRLQPRRHQPRRQHRPGRGRGRARPPARARAAALERRHELHDRGRPRSACCPKTCTTGYEKLKCASGPTGSVRRVWRDGERANPTGDALPEDLDVTAYVGPYVFPDIRRRRIAGDDLRGASRWRCIVAGHRVSATAGFVLGGGAARS